MKRMILFVTLVCFCFGSSFSIYAQAQKRRGKTQPKASQPQKPTEEVSQPQKTGSAQQNSINFVAEGVYDTNFNNSDLGTITFQVTLKRDGGKWAGEVNEAPLPLTVKSVLVDKDGKVVLILDASGTTATATGMYEGGEITGGWDAGDIKGTWKAVNKKAVSLHAQQKTSQPQTPDQTNKLPNTQSTRARSTSPDTAAQVMVKALRDNHLAGGSTGLFDAIGLEGDEKTALGSAPGDALNTALATTGEYLTDQQKFQGLAMFAGFFTSRRPLTPKKVADYLTRFQIIDKATVEKWRTAQSKSDAPGSPTLTLAGIAFHDFLFEGGQWKNGNPDRAIVRLGSLTNDAVSRWKAAVASKDEAYGAWSLLAVDSLFVNDTFQPSVFDTAFPIARKLLSAR
jgi:hypothetical protein